ncbi:hypothetical protein [Nonomuraea typhae]|uniref:hypothetical protein n=1 Tax=Nonomuraea typhae TaxID=2603600 RepID=UPI0012FA5836|nr:hypothetical protein [Nonomuraea typhae]
MDSASLAAAALLSALSRAAGTLAELHHPFVPSLPFSYLHPPAGAVAGTVFTLPDGREVRFAVSIAVADGAYRVGGEVIAEDEALLDLPRKSVPELDDALELLDEYTAEVSEPAGRLLDELLEELR